MNTALTLQIGGDVSKLRSELAKANAAMGGFQGQIKKASNALGTLGVSFSTAGTVLAIGALTKQIFHLGVAQEQTNIAFETFLGSADKAKFVIDDLTKFSVLTPFTPDEVFKAGKALLAFGIEAEKLIPTLTAVGDISSGTGKNFNELAVIFGKAKVQGTLFAEDINQLTEAGVPIIQEFAKQLGVTEDKVKKMGSQGKITFPMLEQGFKNLTSEGGRFFQLMDKQSRSVGGKLSTIQGNLEEIGKKLFEANAGPISDFVGHLADITSHVDGIAGGIKGWISLLTIVPRTALKAAASFSEINDAIKSGNVGLMGFKGISNPKGDNQTGIEKGEEDKAWDEGIKKLKAIASGMAAAKVEAEKFQKQYKKLLDTVGFKSRDVKRGGVDVSDELYSPEINMDPMSSFGIDLGSPVAGIVEEIEFNEELHQSLLTLKKDRKEQLEQMEKTADMAVTMGESIGSAFEGMISGSMNFAQALTRVTEEIITMYLKQSIAAMIASSLKDPSTPFPLAKIAMATAGIGIVKGLFAGLGGGMSGGGGGGGPVGVRPSEMNVNVSSRSRISGYHLDLVSEKEGYRRSRVG